MPRNNDTPLKHGAHPEGSRLLLHICCGPCAIMPIRRCQDEGFIVTTWFYNPNIHPFTEYLRRREAAQQACETLGVEFLPDDASWNITTWLRAVAGQDVKPARCAFCCKNRVAATFYKAQELGLSFFSTSLLYSRYQPHDIIAKTGQCMADAPQSRNFPAFVYRDFRADWQEGIEHSKKMHLYRQNYCGCIYSEAERHAGRLPPAPPAGHV